MEGITATFLCYFLNCIRIFFLIYLLNHVCGIIVLTASMSHGNHNLCFVSLLLQSSAYLLLYAPHYDWHSLRGIFRESVSASVSSKLVEESVKLGNNSNVIKEGRFAGVQALFGTGACRLFAEFQKHFYPESKIYLPDPTWSK